MEMYFTQSPDAMVVTILGKLDSRTVPEFRKSCADWTVMPTILDLTGLEYLSSSALRALLQLKRQLGRKGMMLALAGTNGFVAKVLRVSGFDQIFLLYPTVQDARMALGRGEMDPADSFLRL